MSMFAGQNGGPYSGSVTNPMMNPMMNNYSQNISAWMAPKQYGILATGVGSARDNILPGNVTKINRGKSSTRNRRPVAVPGSLVTAKLKCIQTNTNSYWGRNDMRWKSVWNLPWENKQKRNKKCKARFQPGHWRVRVWWTSSRKGLNMCEFQEISKFSFFRIVILVIFPQKWQFRSV